jgi:hypothetical protein
VAVEREDLLSTAGAEYSRLGTFGGDNAKGEDAVAKPDEGDGDRRLLDDTMLTVTLEFGF